MQEGLIVFILSKDNSVLKGTIIDSYLSDDLSYHGSSMYEVIYVVLGEDNNIYKGVYGRCISSISDYYFKTEKDYLLYLKGIIKHNIDRIDLLKKENNNISNVIKKLTKKDE